LGKRILIPSNSARIVGVSQPKSGTTNDGFAWKHTTWHGTRFDMPWSAAHMCGIYESHNIPFYLHEISSESPLICATASPRRTSTSR
jgi:hypothetical protein